MSTRPQMVHPLCAALAIAALLAAPAFSAPPARPPLAPPAPSVAPSGPARAAAAAGAASGGANLCFNPSFDVGTNGLDGWTADYTWEGNSHYMDNHTRVSVLKSFEGRSSVLFIRGSAAETKVDSKPIAFDVNSRYRCSMLVKGTMPHIYFAGFKWVPGIRPYEDPHVGDLRKIYKSEFRNHDIGGGPGGWKRVSFEFPLPNLSDLAKKHLSEVRFVTVYLVVVDTEKGDAYIDDVEVKKIQ